MPYVGVNDCLVVGGGLAAGDGYVAAHVAAGGEVGVQLEVVQGREVSVKEVAVDGVGACLFGLEHVARVLIAPGNILWRGR